MNDRTDVVKAARAGDGEAFEALLLSDAPLAHRVILGIIPEPADAEDVLQEAMIRAWRDLPKLRKPTHWPGWFRRIAVRAALDHARSASRHPTRGLLPIIASDANTNGQGSVDQRDEILQALRALPHGERALLVLRFGADLPMSDVAHSLDIPLGTAKSRLHRSLARLRNSLEMTDDS
jgi:RNA polymerase sigma-70 factor (ECF subfamily)